MSRETLTHLNTQTLIGYTRLVLAWPFAVVRQRRTGPAVMCMSSVLSGPCSGPLVRSVLGPQLRPSPHQ
jgi:hypothetical protein